MIGSHKTWTAVASLSLLLAASSASVAGPDGGEMNDSEERRVRVIEIDRDVDCDGENCTGTRHHAFAIDADGVADMLSLGGHPMGGAFLGVGLTALTPELRAHFGAPEGEGVMVSKVVDDSPAARAGVLMGDVITRVDGEPVDSSHALSRRIRRHEDADVVGLEVWRDGRLESLSATLEEREGLFGHGDEHRIVIRCDDGDDCGDLHGLEGFDCGESPCKVRVECDGGRCDCAVNGESVDCASLPGVPHDG